MRGGGGREGGLRLKKEESEAEKSRARADFFHFFLDEARLPSSSPSKRQFVVARSKGFRSPLASMVLIDPEALECPLCAEQLDATELCLRLCECDYKICLFCYQRLVDDAAAEKSSGGGGGAGSGGVGQQGSSSSSAPRCPNCRTPYDTARIDGQAPDPAE